MVTKFFNFEDPFRPVFQELEAVFPEAVSSPHTKRADTSTKYPPFNICKIKDTNSYFVEYAVAGFTKDELSVTMADGVLTVTGEKASVPDTIEYRHRGIGLRSFTRTIPVEKEMKFTSCTLKDGILKVSFERVVEEKKTEKIDISVS